MYKNKSDQQAYDKRYRQEHRERKRETNRIWYQNNKEEKDRKNAQWRKDNPDKVRELRRKRYRENPIPSREAYSRWASRNVEYRREYNKHWREYMNQESSRKSRWRQQGIDPDAAWDLWVNSPHECAVCGKTSRLQVDHDHSTGKIRGILCPTCNRGLGMFYDDPVLLEKALVYLNSGRIG